MEFRISFTDTLFSRIAIFAFFVKGEVIDASTARTVPIASPS